MIARLCALLKAAEDQPRDENGRWTTGALSAEEQATARAALASAPRTPREERHFSEGEEEIHPSSAGFERGGARIFGDLPSYDHSKWSVHTVPTAGLRYAQPGVTVRGVEHHIGANAFEADDGSSMASNDVVSVVKDRDGKYYVQAGHHRVAAQMLAGRKAFRAWVIEVADEKPGRFGQSKIRYKRLGAKKVDLAALLRKGLDAESHAAATSDLNLLRRPTERQARAGNYRKGHWDWKGAGLRVSVENPAGSRRRPEWPPLTGHYGYVRGTEGADGDQVDVIVRPGTPDDWAGSVYVVDQLDQRTGGFDEHKCLVGYDCREDAVRAYLGNYTRGWRLGHVTELGTREFRDWALGGDTLRPLSSSRTPSGP